MKLGKSANGIPTSTPSSLVKSSSAGSYLVRSKLASLASAETSAQEPWKLARPALPTGPTMSGAEPAASCAFSVSYDSGLWTTCKMTQASVCFLLNASTQAFSFGITSASPPAPRPTYQVILVAVGAQPSPPVTTVGGTVGVGGTATVAVAPAGAAAVVFVAAAGAAAVVLVAAAAGTAVAVEAASPPQAASSGRSMASAA